MRWNRKGGAVTEFALTALAFMILVTSALEWTFELYLRSGTARVNAAISAAYSQDKDFTRLEEVVKSQGNFALSSCLQPVRVTLFDELSGVDFSSSKAGYNATGNPADKNAVLAHFELVCIWDRKMPSLRMMLGRELKYVSTVVREL